jgi:hypothetical protein
MRALASFIMQGRAQAVGVVTLAAALSLLLPLFSMFSAAALALVALRKGYIESLWVFGIALAMTVGIGLFTVASADLGFWFGVLLWLPILLIAWTLRASANLATSLELAFGFGCLAVLAIYSISADPAAYWAEWLQALLKPILAGAPPEVDVKAISGNISKVARYMSGMVVGSWVIFLVLILLMARWWQDMLFNPGGFRGEFLTMRMHAGLAYVAVAAMLVAAMQDGTVGEIASNLGVQFLLLYTFGGLAVMHGLVSKPGSGSFLMAGLYVMLFFVPYLALPVALVGVSDVWLDWRRRQGLPG